MNKEIKEILEYLKNDFYAYGETYIEEKCKIVTKKENHQLLDYITNLQEENERLKEVINDDMTTYLKGLEDGKDKMKECYNSVYKSRIDKAIEYIERAEVSSIGTPYSFTKRGKDLLNILNSGDEE